MSRKKAGIGIRLWENKLGVIILDKPNVLYVFADQLRYSSVGCCGNKQVKTLPGNHFLEITTTWKSLPANLY